MVGKYNQNWNYFHFELKANAFFFSFFLYTPFNSKGSG